MNYICKDCGITHTANAEEVAAAKMFDLTIDQCDQCIDEESAKKNKQDWNNEAEARYKAVVPDEYRETRINHENFNTRLWEEIKGYSVSQGWLGIVGDTGNCKTRCLSLLIKKLIYHHKRHIGWCLATGWHSLAWAAQNKFNDKHKFKASELIEQWTLCDVLVIDDLGKEKMTDTIESELFGIIEYRCSHKKTTLWSANTHPETSLANNEFSKDRGAPIVGRLIEFSKIIEL